MAPAAVDPAEWSEEVYRIQSARLRAFVAKHEAAQLTYRARVANERAAKVVEGARRAQAHRRRRRDVAASGRRPPLYLVDPR